MKCYYKTNPQRKKYLKVMRLSGEQRVPVIFICINTTGLEPGSITQLAAVKTFVRNGMFTPVAELNLYFKPDAPVSNEVANLTGLTNEFLDKHSPISVSAADIKTFFGDKYIIAGHNVRFIKQFTDAAGLNSEVFFTPMFWLDTLYLAQDAVRPGLTHGYGASELFNFFGFDTPGHDAIASARSLVRLANRLMDRNLKDPSSTGKFVPMINGMTLMKFDDVDKIVVETEYGKVYLNCQNGFWEDRNDILLRFFNMDELEYSACIRIGASDIRDLVKKMRKLKTA